MSAEWEAYVQSNWAHVGIEVIWARDIPGGGREVTNGSTAWIITNEAMTNPQVQPLQIREDQGRALLAALLRHYNGADDARMLRKDYDHERARVDKMLDALLTKGFDGLYNGLSGA